MTSNSAARMGLRRAPAAFTEHGVAMLSSVLHSRRAVQMNILIIRAFVKLRQLLATHKDLARKIEDLERQQNEHGQQLTAVYSVVKQLIDSPSKPKRRIGFHGSAERARAWEDARQADSAVLRSVEKRRSNSTCSGWASCSKFRATK